MTWYLCQRKRVLKSCNIRFGRAQRGHFLLTVSLFVSKVRSNDYCYWPRDTCGLKALLPDEGSETQATDREGDKVKKEEKTVFVPLPWWRPQTTCSTGWWEEVGWREVWNWLRDWSCDFKKPGPESDCSCNWKWFRRRGVCWKCALRKGQ